MPTFEKHNLPLVATFIACAGLLAACSTTPDLDAKHGDAVRMAKQLQTLNPTAPMGNNPALGIDGQSAVNTQGRYHESFKAPPTNQSILGIGGNLTGN